MIYNKGDIVEILHLTESQIKEFKLMGIEPKDIIGSRYYVWEDYETKENLMLEENKYKVWLIGAFTDNYNKSQIYLYKRKEDISK